MARRKPSWLRRGWWFNVRRHLEGTTAWGAELAVEGLVQEGLLQFLQGGEFVFVEADYRKRERLIFERSKIDVVTGCAFSLLFQQSLECLEQKLQILVIRKPWVDHDSNFAVWKTGIKVENCGFANGCSDNRYADSAPGPQATLR